MSYEVLARKWRPKNFSELAGQDSVQRTLSNAIKKNRLYPVLLFSGPRGTGKTSTARILAKTLRCQNRKQLIPCETCNDCRMIQASRHLDVIEIDGASNNGVDAVRELRSTVGYMPSSGSWKIYIIDEVHMLSNSAFNALLKTLEEPPRHVIFIMATTESHKIPLTVLSRAQNLNFHLIPPHLIKNHLETICKKENFVVKEEVLWTAAKQARGSMRDGQSLLDQIITFCGEDTDKTEVTRMLGLSDPDLLSDCLRALVHRKEKDMLDVIGRLKIKGGEPLVFLQSLIEGLAQMLFLKQNPNNKPQLVQASQQEIDEIKQNIDSISYEDLHLLFDMLLKGEREMSFCHDSQMVLEVLLFRFCGAPRLEEIIPFQPIEGHNTHSIEEQKTKPIEGHNTHSIKAKSSNTTQQNTNSNPHLNTSPDPHFKINTNKPLNTHHLKPVDIKPADLKPATIANKNLKQEPPLYKSQEILNGKKRPKISIEKKKENNTTTPLNFANQSRVKKNSPQGFAFWAFVKKEAPLLASYLEHLCLMKEKTNQDSFCFLMPVSLSRWIKEKIKSQVNHNELENLLTKFLKSPQKIKIEFVPCKEGEQALSLIEEKELQNKEKKLQDQKIFFKKIESNPFINKVKELFDADIKPLS